MRIELARTADLDSVAAIEKASFGDPWPKAAFKRLIGDPLAIFLVGRGSEGGVDGYVVAVAVAGEGEVLNVAVSNGARRTGLGGKLLDAVLLELRARSVTAAFLEVRNSNSSARGLYESRGFADVARRRGYYVNPAEDAIVMRAALAPLSPEESRSGREKFADL
ncbi:MAG TPA: ribosomal protein S18-alanine N-acetyltransferase [Gemmatimonadaceae bacterium]|nr:ribosomal protein S18-alanine N-acetyltransferase [Gemmatimonadaceae bacterium]